MTSLSTRQKLLAGFGVLAGTAVVTAGLGLVSLGKASQRFTHYIVGPAEQTALANDVLDATNARAVAARNLVLVTDAADVQAEKSKVTQAHEKTAESLRRLKTAVAGDPTASKLVAAIEAVESKYGPVAEDIVAKALAGDRDAAVQKMNAECRPLLAALIDASNAFLVHARERGQAESAAADAAYADTRLLMLGVLALAVGIAGALGWAIPRALMRSLGAEPAELGLSAQRIAAGDLGPIHGAERAPAGSVLASMAAMRASLVQIVGQVRTGSDGIATASTQIAQGNQDLSSRTEEQASSLQQTAASMEQLGTTVKHNADNAQQANQLALGASQVARRGGEVVERVVETMKGINDSSRRIADIITVIDGIAFQTNILALNAAVEAARAGEQGRGFAVVAAEVRSLAQRSAEAAKEIKSLITDSVERVEAGTALVDRAGATMQEIVGSIGRVTEIVGQISSASAEQSAGVSQVGDAVGQMDQVTQQNAALVEESAAAAESLKQQAQQLVQAVAVFRLSGVPA